MLNDLDVANSSTDKVNVVSWIKIVCGITSAACFGFGIRAAYSQARPFKPGEISRAQFLSGMSFATRSLTIATILTCSGYALFVVAITTAMDIKSPKQFGTKMTKMFGSRLRIAGSEKSQQFEDIFKNN